MTGQVVITGAAGGIGRELVPLLAGAGWRMLLVDRAEAGVAALAAAHGAVAHEGSPLTAEECRAAMTALDGPVDALVHLAGTFEKDPTLGDDPAIWERTMANNLTNAYNFATALDGRLAAGRTGRIVFISSLAFRRGGVEHVAYSSAKGGLVGMTRALARRFGTRATVNSLAPGIIDTPMPAAIIAERGQTLVDQIPLRRFGHPREVATVIRFLLSEDASYITGQCLNVDGGHSMN